jgi:hypothetical protein
VRDLKPQVIEKRLNESNILIPTTVLWDDQPDGRGGLRVSVQEATRQGMCEGDMAQVASLVKRSADGEDPFSMRVEVERFVAPFRKLRYCFRTAPPLLERILRGRCLSSPRIASLPGEWLNRLRMGQTHRRWTYGVHELGVVACTTSA